MLHSFLKSSFLVVDIIETVEPMEIVDIVESVDIMEIIKPRENLDIMELVLMSLCLK